MLEALGAAARRLGLRGPVGVEAAHVTQAALRAIPDAAPHDVTATLARWREVKDDTERALIRDRVAALDAAYAAVRSAIRPGATERDVLAAAYRALLERVDEPLVLNYNLASGPRTALDNPRATARRLEAGDLVLVDLYPVLDGYVADLTRTFVVGTPTRSSGNGMPPWRPHSTRPSRASGQARRSPGSTTPSAPRCARPAATRRRWPITRATGSGSSRGRSRGSARTRPGRWPRG